MLMIITDNSVFFLAQCIYKLLMRGTTSYTVKMTTIILTKLCRKCMHVMIYKFQDSRK